MKEVIVLIEDVVLCLRVGVQRVDLVEGSSKNCPVHKGCTDLPTSSPCVFIFDDNKLICVEERRCRP